MIFIDKTKLVKHVAVSVKRNSYIIETYTKEDGLWVKRHARGTFTRQQVLQMKHRVKNKIIF